MALSVKIVLIDFHTHTTASDGALQPSEMIERALARNIELLAITDHDTVAGYQAAAEYYTHKSASMRLLSGVEFSCRWSGTTIHVLGLDMDVTAPAMREGLARLDLARRERGIKIAQRLPLRSPNATASASTTTARKEMIADKNRLRLMSVARCGWRQSISPWSSRAR